MLSLLGLYDILIIHLSLWFLFLFFSKHTRPVQEDYAVSSNPQSLWSAPWSFHATAVAREPRRGQTTRTWARRKMMKGLQEEAALLNKEERKTGMTTTGTEKGRREKVQREEEVGVLREAERVGRQRKVSVCLVGSSNIGLCFVFFFTPINRTQSAMMHLGYPASPQQQPSSPNRKKRVNSGLGLKPQTHQKEG